MNRNLHPEEFEGHLGKGEEAGLYWSDPGVQSGFARELAQPGRKRLGGSQPRFAEFDSDWQHWAPETVSDSGRALASYLSGSGHRSERN